MTPIELGWIAGLVEGEGCLTTMGLTPKLEIAMTDRDVIDKAAGLLGSRVITEKPRPTRPTHKPMYHTTLCGRRAAAWMMTLWSLLGERRRGRATQIIRDWVRRVGVNWRDRSRCPSGHPYDAVAILKNGKRKRRCQACRRQEGRAFRARRRQHSPVMKRLLLAALALLVAGPAFAERFGRYGDLIGESLHQTSPVQTAAWTSATGVNTTLPAASPYLDVRGYSTVAYIFRVAVPGVDITQGTALFECAHDNLIFAQCHGSIGIYGTNSIGIPLNLDPTEGFVNVGGFSYFRLRSGVVITGSGTANLSIAATTARSDPSVIVMNNPLPVAGCCAEGTPSTSVPPVLVAGTDPSNNTRSMNTDTNGNVSVASAKGPVTSATWTNATSVDTVLSADVSFFAAGFISVSCTGSPTGGTLQFEGSADGGSSYPFPLLMVINTVAASNSQLTATNYAVANGAGYFERAVSGFTNIRVRLNPVISGGSSPSCAVKINPAGLPNANLTTAMQTTALNLLMHPDSGGTIGAAPPTVMSMVGGVKSGATGGFVGSYTACDSVANISVVTAATTSIITGVSGRLIHICSISLFTAGANNVAVIEGSGGTCTSPVGLWGGTTAATGLLWPAGGGFAYGSGQGDINRTTVTGNNLCIITSAAVQLSGRISYAIY